MLQRRHHSESKRTGAVLVEFALIVSIFAACLAALIELGHVYLVINTLNAATKRAARHGVVEGVSTADVIAKAEQFLNAGIKADRATIMVRDASIFDSPSYSVEEFKPGDLPPLELLQAESRQMFMVRIEVPYDDVALMPPFFLKNLKLSSQSVIRHE